MISNNQLELFAGAVLKVLDANNTQFGLGTVSYTHLDVYKRQDQGLKGFRVVSRRTQIFWLLLFVHRVMSVIR